MNARRETLLFDLRNDPLELTNLAAKPRYQTVLTDMLKQLLAELARTEMPARYKEAEHG